MNNLELAATLKKAGRKLRRSALAQQRYLERVLGSSDWHPRMRLVMHTFGRADAMLSVAAELEDGSLAARLGNSNTKRKTRKRKKRK